VHYFAPRATRTGMNASAVDRMNAELKVAMDPPAQVAAAACAMLEAGKTSTVFGWPEKLFVRINALLPGVVDGSLRKQLPVIRRHAAAALAERATQS
jgi:short-subunit dehydrogenase